MFTKTVFTWRKQSAHLPSTKEEEEHFLDDNSSDCNLKSDVPKARIHPKERIAWLTLSVLLTSISCLSWFLRNDQQLQNSYEHGFNTDLQPAKSAITLIETEFYGGIIVNSTGDFNLVLNPDEELYIGTPTRELDASWDRLVGSYIALDTKEASRINGGLSLENGAYYVVLHCLNYLRKALYNHWYPTILTESRDHVPPYFMHVAQNENEMKANDWALHQQCIGMNGGQDFGRRAQSSVLLVTDNARDSSVLLGNVSIVVFELEDEKLGGVETPNGKEYYCNFDNVAAGLCAPEQMGEFLVTKDARAAAANPVVTRNWPLDQPMFVSYQVNQPGYFCVASFSPTGSTFSLTMSITNQGHRLPAFRQRTLDIYRWLAPISLSLFAVWNYAWAVQRRLSAPVSIHALVWLSVIAIAARWVALDWFDQHITRTNSLSRLLASTNCLFVIQTILLFAAAVRSVGVHLETKLPTTTTFIAGVLSLFAPQSQAPPMPKLKTRIGRLY
ncbi:hypothetical protein G7Y89_g12179 [Cudoniella acicularis]|uniref:PTM1-like N-terminal domain-containing protein n=1 Tax=Cudoniella acicularis TaxID=354080 RepID=A0A8H4RCB9_9HELO|nr:hypothetical protein G7Y89_g12179 [Cudoniella acicularis]